MAGHFGPQRLRTSPARE